MALNGTSDVTLVGSPPVGVTYLVRRIFGLNSAGGNRTLTLDFKEASTSTPIWASALTANAAYFTQLAGVEPIEFDIHLTNTDESLIMVSDGTGTDFIYATYETRETAPK